MNFVHFRNTFEIENWIEWYILLKSFIMNTRRWYLKGGIE